MAKISQREKILLGYNSNSVSNSSSRRNSEVDFSDVFGGPPRCSAQDYYYNEYDNMDCIDDVDNDVGSSFGLAEKPVFGDQIGARKRYPSDDFYGDIFGGDQALLSCSLSPRVYMPGRNPFGSAPGSRGLSPSQPLSPAPELSASPTKFSLPGRISNADDTTSTSMNQISKSYGRSLSKLGQTFQRITNYRPSSLSRQISIDDKESTSDTKFNGPEYEAEFIMNSNDNIQFHFSIYKWPNKGVPITLASRKRSPSRPKERTNDVLVMENAKKDANVKVDSFSASKRRMPSANTQVSEKAPRKPEGDIGDKDVFPSISNELKSSREVHDYSQKSLDATNVKISPKKSKSNMRPLASLFGDDKEENEAKKGEKESKRKETKKQMSSHKVNKSKVHELNRGAEKETEKSEVTAKVKDVVKKINQETSSKVKGDNNHGVGPTPSHSRRWKDKDTSTNTVEAKDEEVKKFPTRIHVEMQGSFVSLGKTRSQSIEVVDVESYLSEDQYTINGNGSVPEPKIESTKASSPNITSTSNDDQVGKEMLQDIDTDLATESQDETQIYERKVKQWSKGKEGNIRALLSTMQYVLWANSGWKPIPLVDIIEANAVKKSYQRALLCLHPDKLQQKGATPYQKFIAERVFDILQEAWDQFNTIALL